MPVAQMMLARPQMKTMTAILQSPWYKKWWVWALIGGGVVATGTTTVLLLRRKHTS